MERLRLPVIAIAGFLAVGIPYWQIPYSSVSLPSSLLRPGLLVVALGATLASLSTRGRFLKRLAIVAAVVPAAVAVRVFLDTARDATSHNLWPIELLIAFVLGSSSALAGGVLGIVLGWITRRGSSVLEQ